jgi:hypothetical protein
LKCAFYGDVKGVWKMLKKTYDIYKEVGTWIIVILNTDNCALSSSSWTSRIGPFDPFRLQNYSCSLQRFFGLPNVLLPCGL